VEAAKQRREEARNTLEGYLYRVRDLLADENEEHPFRKCSQASERKALAEKLEESITWLHEKGDVAETYQFYDKRNAVEYVLTCYVRGHETDSLLSGRSLERPIVHRYQEIEAFPQALNVSQMWNWSTRLFLQEARTNLTREEKEELPSKWTPEELNALEKSLREHETWLNEWVEKQKSVPFNEDPVIETTEMKARAKALETHLQRLVKRKVPKIKKVETTSTSETVAASETEEASESSSGPANGSSSPPPVEIHDEL
jgi:hypoxia up-regulated 1